MAFTLTSPEFVDGNPIPSKFTCDGNDAPPPLLVSDPPEATQSFAVIMDDPGTRRTARSRTGSRTTSPPTGTS